MVSLLKSKANTTECTYKQIEIHLLLTAFFTLIHLAIRHLSPQLGTSSELTSIVTVCVYIRVEVQHEPSVSPVLKRAVCIKQ